MEALVHQINTIGSAALMGFWLPLIVWTVLCCLVVLAVNARKDLHPLLAYYVHVALTFSLPCGFIAMHHLGIAHRASYPADKLLTQLDVELGPLLISSPAEASPLWQEVWSWTFIAGTLVVVAVILAILSFLRLAVVWRSLVQLKRRLRSVRCRDVLDCAGEMAQKAGVGRPVRIASGIDEAVPFSFGWRKPVLVLPTNIPAGESLRMVLAHEMVHIRRHHYAIHWVEQGIRATFAINPLVSWLVKQSENMRECACDAEVLSLHEADPTEYASLLYRFVPSRGRHFEMTLSMGRTESNLRRRIKMMKRSKSTRKLFLNARNAGVALFVLVIGTVTTFIACTEVSTITGPGTTAVADEDREVFMVVEQMPELIGGLASIQESLRYPETAREQGLEGTVFVQFVVDEDGHVTNAVVVRPVSEDLDAAALAAVKEARFKPGMQRGEPVPVRFAIPIRFLLEETSE